MFGNFLLRNCSPIQMFGLLRLATNLNKYEVGRVNLAFNILVDSYLCLTNSYLFK